MGMRSDERAGAGRRFNRAVLAVALAGASAVLVCSCSSGNKRAAGTGSSAPASAPRQITATPSGGSGGVGPVVAPNGQGTVALGDRTLTVVHAVRGPGSTASSVTVVVDLSVQNPGASTITAASSSFELMGPEGDMFTVKPGGAASLDGAIAPHATRAGTITFDVPAAATSNMRLLYRPGANAQTAMIPLNIG